MTGGIVKRLMILIACVLMLSTAFSFASDVPAVYRVDADARGILVDMKATVYHGRWEGDFLAELTPDQVDRLTQAGFTPQKLFDSAAAKDRYFGQTDEVDEVHNYDQIRTGFLDLESAYSSIASFELLGTSVQGRDLFGLRISNNIEVEEDEPEVAFWGCIHGNEYASAEMPFLYAYYLCENYGSDPVVTDIVDNTEVWCIPLINPDGRTNGTRNNANNVDLNRDFGYNWDGWGGSPYPFSQVESRTVREFAVANNPSLSISFHCSGDEFYYPWGYFPHNAPDYLVLSRLGERYADYASYALMSSFNSYQTHGEILDWAYGCLGGLSFTAEVSSSSSSVPTTFDRNRPGMAFYCQNAKNGLHGMVTDSATGLPIAAAVWIEGDPIPAYTDPEIGDLHRVVLPGTYNLEVWANGYLPQTVNNITVTLATPGEFEIALEPTSEEYAFMVTSVNQNDPNNAYNNVTNANWALGAPDGLPCSLGLDGFIVLDMGEGHDITDGPGDDFTVTEVLHPRDPGPENYRIYAGNAYEQDVFIGNGNGTTSFDLGTAGVTSTRYLKIQDASGSSPDFPLAGMDLDAVTILNSETEISGEAITGINKNTSVRVGVTPNPFNPTTEISIQLSAFGHVNLSVYDVSGRKVATLVDGYKDAGVHDVMFDGSGLTSGVYLYKLTTNQHVTTGKMVLMK